MSTETLSVEKVAKLLQAKESKGTDYLFLEYRRVYLKVYMVVTVEE